jgi:hypothetical protein
VGDNVKLQPLPVWVTMNVLPAMDIVPVRCSDDVFGATVKLTEPVPVRPVPLAIEIQLKLLNAVHEHEEVVVTVAELLVPPAATASDVGETVNEQFAGACVIVKACPAIVTLPVRDSDDELAATAKVTIPLPLPDAPPVTVTQLTLLTAVHVQPVRTVTLTDSVAPAAPGVAFVEDRP